MRRVVVLTAAIVLLPVQDARAGSLFDLPVLRGAITDTFGGSDVDWSGFYAGGQAATGSADMNFENATSDLVARMLIFTTIEEEFNVSRWPIMGKTSQKSDGFGGFVGYNAQWDQAVLGLEVSYIHGTFAGQSAGSLGRMFTTSDGYSNDVFLSGNASMTIHDFASVRGRLGYATGSFLPYAFGGVALGRADITRAATVTAEGTYVGTAVPPPPDYGPVTYSQSELRHNRLVYGYAGGLGIDVMLASGLFLRGEWEYLRFTSDIDVVINTVRGGVGLKF